MSGTADKGLPATADAGQVTAESIDAEPVISPKNSAFNKRFGKVAGNVAEGDDGRQDTVSLAGATPADTDISAWPNVSFGFGQGTDGSRWLLFKDGANTCWGVQLTDYAAPI